MLFINVSLALVAFVVAASLSYGYEKVGHLPRASLSAGILTSADPAVSDEPLNVLLVGTDSSINLDPDDPINVGRDPGSDLADVLMVLRLEPATGEVAILSIPRDLWVPISGTNMQNKINASYAIGGAPALISTIQDYLEIPIHHFVAVDFAGFKKMVEVIGGVDVYFPYPARDAGSGLNITEAGCNHLNADTALQYVRSRKLQENIDGRWKSDGQSDFGRMRRQREFMQQAVSTAIERGARNPATLNALINAVTDAVVVDDLLTPGGMFDIGNAFRMFNPDDLLQYSFQPYVSDDWRGGQMVLILNHNRSDELLDPFRGLAPLNAGAIASADGGNTGSTNGSSGSNRSGTGAIGENESGVGAEGADGGSSATSSVVTSSTISDDGNIATKAC